MAKVVARAVALDPSNKKPTARPRSPRQLRASSQSAVLVKEEYTRWVCLCQWDCAGFLSLLRNFCAKHTKARAVNLSIFLRKKVVNCRFTRFQPTICTFMIVRLTPGAWGRRNLPHNYYFLRIFAIGRFGGTLSLQTRLFPPVRATKPRVLAEKKVFLGRRSLSKPHLAKVLIPKSDRCVR